MESALAAPGLLDGTSRGRIFLRQAELLDLLGRREERGAALNHAVAIADRRPAPRLQVQAYRERGVYFWGLSRFSMASEDLEHALELGGDGLGRFVRDGFGQNNTTLVVGGIILIG